MNVLLLIATVLGVGALLLGAIITLASGHAARAAAIGAVAGGWLSAYAVLLVGASLTSHDQLLAHGQTKHFCGFYLDCHVGVAVIADSFSTTPRSFVHDVTLRFSSDARRETLTPWHVDMFLEASNGMRFPPTAGIGDLERPIPAGGSYDVHVRFELPPGQTDHRLMIRQGGDLLFPEIMLIGDEASLLHRKTWFQL